VGQAELRTLAQTWRGPETRAGGDPRPATITMRTRSNDVFCCVSESPLIITRYVSVVRGRPMGYLRALGTGRGAFANDR
jgi:hypothetical protein